MTTTLHGHRSDASLQFEADVEQVRASTRRLLLTLLHYETTDLAAPATTGLGTRRHILARHSDRTIDALAGRPARIADDLLLRAPLPAVVDAVTASLGAALDAISDIPRDGLPHAATGVIADHLAWLELTRVDLGDGYAVAAIPDPAIDAVAAHFSDDPNSPFAALVAH